MKNSVIYNIFNKLLEITSCTKEALLLDKIIYHHQGTLLKKDNKLWFTRKIPELAKDLGFSESRVYAYLKQLEEAGWIIRKRYKFYGVPRAFIHVTHKLYDTINRNAPVATKSSIDILEKSPPQFIEKNNRMDSVIQKESINKEEIKNEINNIISKKQPEIECYAIPDNIEQLFMIVGDKLSETQKKSIWGAIQNLKNIDKVVISSTLDFVSWVIFCILNSDYHLKNAKCFQHKLNAVMAIARSKQGLKKPKGFDRYWKYKITKKYSTVINTECLYNSQKNLRSELSKAKLNMNSLIHEKKLIYQIYGNSPLLTAQIEQITTKEESIKSRITDLKGRLQELC